MVLPHASAAADFIPVERQLPVGPISSLDMLRLVCDGSIQGFAIFVSQKSCSVEIAKGVRAVDCLAVPVGMPVIRASLRSTSRTPTGQNIGFKRKGPASYRALKNWGLEPLRPSSCLDCRFQLGRAPLRLWTSTAAGRNAIVDLMANPVNQTERIAVVRLLEFLSEKKPWHRSLWGIGVVLAMDEMFEACSVMKYGHLSEGAVKRMASSLQKRVGVHPGFTDAEKQFLREHVQQVPRADGAAHFGIRELSTRVSTDYLARWARAVAAGKFRVEHFARHVGAHLLDAGFAGQYLHDFVKARLDAPEALTLSELCDALQGEMRAKPRRDFQVLLAFSTAPLHVNGAPSSWLTGASITGWLREHRFETSGVRAAAAMIVRVQARDVFGAANAARNEADRYAARAILATGQPLNFVPMLWVDGSAAPVPMKGDSRGVAVRELFREERVFATDMSQDVDAALELLAHLDNSSPPAAIAGGWGAIEGLLADPNDRSSAADNLATLVTCSFPRAELTALSHRAEIAHPEQSQELVGVTVNRGRCRIFGRMIVDDRLPEMPGVMDQAAVARMKKLLANPHQELQTVRDSIAESFHRLYRQRNLILHGGRLDSVALAASLRTVAKLAGAGMDRITHGHYVQRLRPLELVAKANLALALINRASPLDCVDLLEVG